MRRSSSAWMRVWARDSATIAGTQFAALAATTVLAVVVARHLGPSEFGIFAGFLGLSQVLMLFAGFGVATWLLRELSNALANPAGGHRLQADRRLSAALAIEGTLSFVFLVLALAVSLATGTSSNALLALGALMIYTGLLGFATILEVLFRAHRALSRIVVATLLEKLSLTALVIVAVVAGAGLAGIAAGYVAAGALRVAWDLHAIRSARLSDIPAPARADVAGVLRGSIPFGFGTAMPTAVVRLDVFLIGMLSASTAGLYAIAERFIGVLLVLPAAFAGALYPHLARQADPLRASWRAAGALGLLGAVLAGAGILAADVAVSVLFGARYDDAAGGVRIILLAAPLMFAASVLMAGMFSSGYERQVLVVMVACSLAGTGLVLAGRGRFGLEGATAGYVGRNVLLLLALAGLSVALGLRTPPHRPAPEPEDLPAALPQLGA